MKRLHGIRVTFWGQKRRKRNRQKAWKKTHKDQWSIFGFLAGRGLSKNPVMPKGYPNRPQRHLNRA